MRWEYKTCIIKSVSRTVNERLCMFNILDPSLPCRQCRLKLLSLPISPVADQQGCSNLSHIKTCLQLVFDDSSTPQQNLSLRRHQIWALEDHLDVFLLYTERPVLYWWRNKNLVSWLWTGVLSGKFLGYMCWLVFSEKCNRLTCCFFHFFCKTMDALLG